MDKDFETEVIERLVKIETKLDDYNSVKTKTEDAHSKSISNEKRIDGIEDKIKWLTRTIVGGAIAIIFLFIQQMLGLR